MKAIKRKELREKRQSLENKELLGSMIEQRFLSTQLYKQCDTLLLYYSVGSEVSTNEIFRQALLDKKRVAFPVCTDSDGNMTFFFVTDEDNLKEGMYGIRAPEATSEKFTGSENALCVVPALAFDKRGYRLGYGKGYYDRFLEGFDGTSVGLCYEAMLQQQLPTDEYDKMVDSLITDKKIYKFNDRRI